MTPKSNKRVGRYALLALAIVLFAAVVLCGSLLILNWLGNLVLGKETDVAIRTWRDDDRNGVWDESESGLAYTAVHADYVTEGFSAFSTTVGRDGLGRAELISRSDDTIFEIYATVPAGYELTTPERLRLTPDEIAANGVEFGFALLPGQPTPRPTAELNCEVVFENRKADPDIVALLPGPDGSIVLTYRNAVQMLRFAADGSPLPALPAPADFPGNRIAFAPDGRAWAWGEQVADGLAYLEGDRWVTVTPYSQAGDARVDTMAVASDGAAWLATTVGALRRDPDTGMWSRFLADEVIDTVIPDSEGVVWLLSDWGDLWRMKPSDAGRYVQRKLGPRHEISHTFLGQYLTPSGFWIATGRGLAQFDVATETWTRYTAETTNNALEPTTTIWEYAHALDGGEWLSQADELFYARPEEGQWLLVEVPVLQGETIGEMVAAADGSLWLTDGDIVYRCEW